MNNQQKKYIVWVVSDGVAGHFRQSEGLILALKQQFDIEEYWLTIRLKNGLYRQMLKWGLNHQKTCFGLLPWAYQDLNLPKQSPDIVLGAGGKSMYAVASLAQHYQAKSIFVGSLRGLNPSVFDLILTLDDLDYPNHIRVDVAPMPITPQSLAQAKQQWLNEQAISELSTPIFTMLIGGDGAGVKYQATDWEQLAEHMNQLAERYQAKWLVTTSRRTPIEAEHILQQRLNVHHVLQATYWHQQPKKVMQAYLGLADKVFVTAESMTMITEAVYTQKDVIAVLPIQRTINESHQQHLSQFEQKKLIYLWTMNQPLVLDMNVKPQTSTPFIEHLVETLIYRLNLKSE